MRSELVIWEMQEIAIIGNPQTTEAQALIAEVWSQWRPFTILATSNPSLPPDSPELLDNRPLLNNQPTAYVCRNFTCKQPVNSPQFLAEQLNQEIN